MRSNRPSLLSITATLIVPLFAGCGGDGSTPKPAGPSGPPGITDDQGKVTNLSCPGTPGCEKAEGDLMAGFAALSITPTVEPWEDLDPDGAGPQKPNGHWDEGEAFEDKNGNGKWDGVWMAGFDNGRAATAVHDDTWARAVVLEQGDVSIGMVALDCIGYFQQNVVAIRKAAAAEGLTFDHVLVASTHVHESQDTMGMWGLNASETGLNQAYMDFVIKQAVAALKAAKGKQQKATLKVAQAQAPALVNDTRKPIVIDQNINTLQFLDDKGAPFGEVVFWGNHPEALGSDNTQITSDYPHYLRKTLEDKYPGTTAVFFNGPLGGLTTPIRIVGCPDAMGNETCPEGTWERAEYVGKGAAEAAIAVLDSDKATKVTAPALGVKRRGILVQTTNASLGVAVLSGLMPREVFWADGRRVSDAEMATLGLAQLREGDAKIGSEVGEIDIGPVSIATIPGELYTELWLQKPDGSSFIEKPEGADFPDATPETPIQAFLPKGSIKVLVNNANDEIGYIIPKTQFDETPPRAYEPDGQYGEGNSAGYETAPTLTSEFAKMVGK
jgi:hypothetical protein